MHHDTRVCEDKRWRAHCSDDVTWHNSQAHPVTISKDPSSPWPFAPPGPYVVPAHGTLNCNILLGLPPNDYNYSVNDCPIEIKNTPKTVIIS
jgi:hypothetical protein